MLVGVSEGFTKSLEAIGVGYRFNVAGKKITVNAGYSNPVEVTVPEGLSVEAVSNTEIEIKGIDKQKVSEFAANVRKIREPEPYKGKGIRYKGEYVRRKEGKKAAK
jgi:large subunit ribosomal protein L6